MVELLSQYGLFLAQVVTVVIAIIVVIAAVASSRSSDEDSGDVKITCLNEEFDKMEERIKNAIFDKEQLKQEAKEKKKADKAEAKAKKKSDQEDEKKPRVFVLDYDGDIKASGHESLAKEISSVLMVAESSDEIVLRLESPGGMVHAYGLTSSQLDRIKKKEIPLTICVDKMAASGGYMMACIADKILAAPFAIVGSIGVMATVTNFNKILKKNDVDVEIMTAGKFKRTVSMFGEITDEGREKFIEELDDTHELFKDHIKERRPVVDIEDIATGEHWYGTRALEKKLIDGIMTSDEYLLDKYKEADIFQVKFREKKTLADKFGIAVEGAMTRALEKVAVESNLKRFL